MATKTVYLPITIETEDEISDAQAKALVNTMKNMINNDYYNRDNMFDNAMEFDIPLVNIQILKSMSINEIVLK